MGDVTDRGQQVYEKLSMVVAEAMNRATEEGGNVSDVLYVGLNAVAGALVPVAALVGFTPNGRRDVTLDEQNAAINNTSMLVAALLTAKVANMLPDRNVTMDYGPHQIFKAIDAAQKVLGADPRPNLSKPMVKAADGHKPADYLGNSWNVNNSPSNSEDERPRYLN